MLPAVLAVAAVAARDPAPAGGATCLPSISGCLRGAGSLQRYDPEDAPSLSAAACCAACSARAGCQGYMLDAVGGPSQSCWLLPKFALKPSDPEAGADNCTSGAMAAPPNPGRLAYTARGPAGIWVQHGDTNALLNQSFVLGGDTAVVWRDVEVADDVWDWAATDNAFARQAAAGFFIETALMVGDAAPLWLYDRKEDGGGGVTPVNVTPAAGHTQQPIIFPSYLEQGYQQYFLRAVDRFAEHIASLPKSIRSKIIASQAMYGSTGDDCPWHGQPVDPAQDICAGSKNSRTKQPCPRVGGHEDEWHNFTMSTAPAICASYTKREIKVLWNTNVSRLDQLTAECPGSFIKAGMVSHSFSVNYEADNFLGKGKICHTEGYRCRGESWPFCQWGNYKEAPLWATYTHLLWQLTFGVDLPGLSQPNLLNASYAPLYENVFNRYAGSIRPPTTDWVGGIIALHDGLDAANFSRFPATQFGPWEEDPGWEWEHPNGSGHGDDQKVARLQNIARAFAHRGAVERDPHAAAGGAMGSRRRNGTNDVGYRTWQGNYGNGLVTQLQPFESSVGWWGVGPHDQPFGRYARGFEAASGRNHMAFVLDTRLWGGLPLGTRATAAGSPRVPALNLTLAVTYLDGSGGSFDIFFDTTAGCDVPKRSIHVSLFCYVTLLR